MTPKRNPPSTDVSTRHTDEEQIKLQVITQQTRFDIVQNIIAHPEQLITLAELDYFLEYVTNTTIRNHLDKLTENDIVARVKLDEEDRSRDNPHVFYALTESARDLLDEAELLHNEKILQESTSMTRVPEHIEQCMQAPRPEWGPAKSLEISRPDVHSGITRRSRDGGLDV